MIVLSHYPNDPRVRREAEALVKNNHKVHVVCLRLKNELEHEEFHGVKVSRILESRPKDSILQYIYLTGLFFLKSIRFINKIFSQNEYDLIQIHNLPDFLVFVTIRQKLKGIPIVLDLHDIMTELYKSRWKTAVIKILLPIVGIIEKLSWLYADALITTSEGFKNCILRKGMDKNKITLVLNTADPLIFNKPKTEWFKNDSCPRLLYHGTVVERFGVHIVIDSIRLLKDKYPDIRFDIYGNYNAKYKKSLEENIRKHDLIQNVSLHEYVSLEMICSIIRESDFGIVPYISDNFMDLALSTKTFEYVAMKLPVVASDLPSTQSIFDKNQIYYFKQGSAEDLAEILSNAFKNCSSLKIKVQNAANNYGNINWLVMQDRYVKLIENISINKS